MMSLFGHDMLMGFGVQTIPVVKEEVGPNEGVNSLPRGRIRHMMGVMLFGGPEVGCPAL